MDCPYFRVLSDFRKDRTEYFHDCFKQAVILAIELKLAESWTVIDTKEAGLRGVRPPDKP
jgi:hypothetical protein